MNKSLKTIFVVWYMRVHATLRNFLLEFHNDNFPLCAHHNKDTRCVVVVVVIVAGLFHIFLCA